MSEHVELPVGPRNQSSVVPASLPNPDPRSKRPEFLLEIYKQMMAEINRHILVVWQSIGLVIGSFAVLGLVEKKVLSLDFAASLFVLIAAWSLALLIDSSYWYNRNLCIIANIERLFLLQSDLKHVHYYFGAHRPKNGMITTLKAQVYLSAGLLLLVLAYHSMVQVLPGLNAPLTNFDAPRILPYVASIVSGVLVWRLRARRRRDYEEFLANSPGVSVDSPGIVYGGGHGFEPGGG